MIFGPFKWGSLAPLSKSFEYHLIKYERKLQIRRKQIGQESLAILPYNFIPLYVYYRFLNTFIIRNNVINS